MNARSLTRSAFAVAPFSNPFLLAGRGAALGRAALTAATVFAAVKIDKFFSRTAAP